MGEQGDRVEGSVGDDADTTAIGKNIKQDKTTAESTGNVVNVYPTPEDKPRPRRRARKSSVSMAGTVEEKIRDKLNEHDVKLARLEIADATVKENLTDYVRELRADIIEIKKELRPLVGLGIQPQPKDTTTDKAQAQAQGQLIIRLLTIIAAAGGVVGIVFIVLLIALVYLMFGGGVG